METMLSEALQEFVGLLGQLIKNLLGSDAKEWSVELKKFLRKEPCWGANGSITKVAQPKPTPSILELVGTVVAPATTTKFFAKKKFVVNTEHDALVKISYLGDNFKAWFLNGDGKTEDPISEQTLRYHKLRKSSVDAPIITELGGEAKAETTLSEMFALMVGQKHCGGGVLLNNGYANIFYIRDKNGVLRAVIVRWSGDGWFVRALSLGSAGEWNADNRVFSRDFVPVSSAT